MSETTSGGAASPPEPPRFQAELAADERFERRLFWRQLAIVLLVAALIALRVVFG